MAKFIVGKKENMTQIFDEAGNVHPVTVISASPMTVTQIKNAEKDGYVAIQLGSGERREKLLSKAVKGHLKGLGNFRTLREWRVEDVSAYKVGDKIDLSTFKDGDMVNVSGVSKGKGFQGVVKRHGFSGGARTHGQKHSEREPGAIGGGARAGGRVAKGIRMAGRMGGDTVTVRNLKLVKVDLENAKLYIEGAVPGRRGTIVEVKGQ